MEEFRLSLEHAWGEWVRTLGPSTEPLTKPGVGQLGELSAKLEELKKLLSIDLDSRKPPE
jgi:hypothetical protein